MAKCLCCYKTLKEGQTDYHPACARRLFGTRQVPVLPYRRSDIGELARQVIRSQTTLTGVQAKLSLDVNPGGKNEPTRFTIVGLWGRFILKPQSDRFGLLPEIEDLTMHLAEDARISVVPHGLVRFQDGELCYITRRIDRLDDGSKLPMEDMCQLTERLTEYKYKGSYEQIAKAIRQYSSRPWLDLVNFWEVVVFSWLTGNADMHLKNFSLYNHGTGYGLTPAYDLLSTALVMPEDTEELALTLNGKKRKIRLADFKAAMLASGLTEKVIANMEKKFRTALPKWFGTIDASFLPGEMKRAYKRLILQHAVRLLEPVTQKP
jgi:serine/threonine-protein kinase HipA